MTPRLSIIIPVFNVQKFIEACLYSVFSQISNDVEIILVDDGSPDESINIVKKLFSKWLDNGQLILLEQKNMGPGAARNYGLSVARGDYIGFLDSDDVLLENYFISLFKIVDKYETDIIEFGFQRFHKISDIKNNKYFPLYKFKGVKKLTKVRNQIFSVGVWFPSTRIYKKEIFENIQFPVGVFYEDLMTIPYIYLKNLKVYFIEKPLIGYRFNPNSTTALHSKLHAQNIYTFYMSLTNLKHSIPTEIIRIKTARSIVYFYNELGDLEFSMQNIIKDIKKIKKHLYLLKILKYPDLLFFLFPNIYIWANNIRLNTIKWRSK